MDTTGLSGASRARAQHQDLADRLRRSTVPSKNVYLSTLCHSDMLELWPITSEVGNLSLLDQVYGADGENFEHFDQVLATEIGNPQKVHFTVKDLRDDRPRGWGRIELTETDSPLVCVLFFPDGAAEMSIQVLYLIMKSAFDCDGYTELQVHFGKLTCKPGCEHKVWGFGLANILRNQHMARARSTTTDVYVFTAQQWRILKSCIEVWLSALGKAES